MLLQEVMNLLENEGKALCAILEKDNPGPLGDADFALAYASAILSSLVMGKSHMRHKDTEKFCHF